MELQDSDTEDVTVTIGGVAYPLGKKRKGDKEKESRADPKPIAMGEIVVANSARWKRIEGLPEDRRQGPHFNTHFKTNLFNDHTKELDVFEALRVMPISKDELLEIVRWLPWRVLGSMMSEG
jgi:hypothetical protein